MENQINKLSISHYVACTIVLLLAVVSGVFSSYYFEVFQPGFIYGAVLFFIILLLNRYFKIVTDYKDNMKLYGIAVLTVITSTIGYIVAAVSLPILPAVLGMPRDISALFIGSLSSGALGALITFFPLQFTELFKRWWIVALIGGLLAAFTSIFALDFPNINGPAFAPTAGDVISEPLLLFVVWQAGMSIYLIFCSLMSKRY